MLSYKQLRATELNHGIEKNSVYISVPMFCGSSLLRSFDRTALQVLCSGEPSCVVH